MKKKILLIDPSLTVQKVVSLTLDRNRFHVVYAKTRAEALKVLSEGNVDLILVSDQVPEITASSFPKELELMLGRGQKIPQAILITAQDVKDARHYAAVLKKPFTPQNLQLLVHEHLRPEPEGSVGLEMDEGIHVGASKETDAGFEVAFNQKFSDEVDLVKETFKGELESADPTLLNLEDLSSDPLAATQEVPHPSAAFSEPLVNPADGDDLWSQKPDFNAPTHSGADETTQGGDLWGAESPGGDMVNEGTVAMTLPLEDTPAPKRKAPLPTAKMPAPGGPSMVSPANSIGSSIDEAQLMRIVTQAVEKLVPPIVEKLVKEKLDQLLKEQEQWIDSKP